MYKLKMAAGSVNISPLKGPNLSNLETSVPDGTDEGWFVGYSQ